MNNIKYTQSSIMLVGSHLVNSLINLVIGTALSHFCPNVFFCLLSYNTGQTSWTDTAGRHLTGRLIDWQTSIDAPIKKAESLLEFLHISNEETKKKLKEIIVVRDPIIHRGKFTGEDSDPRKVNDAYLDLITILTRIFLKILPADDTFLNEFDKRKWHFLH